MCVRKRRKTGSTARISALDAPMALNWLAAAQVAFLLILTDNSAALFSYSATILLGRVDGAEVDAMIPRRSAERLDDDAKWLGLRAHLDGLEPTVDEAAGYYARDDGPAVPLDAYRAFFATVFGKMEMAEARLPHNCRERRLPFLLCRHRRKDAEARAGDDLLVKLAIDAPLDLVRKVLKYV